MKAKKSIIAVLAVAAMLAACSGGRKADAPDLEVVDNGSNQLAQAISSGDKETRSLLADSMALYVDDLTPDQTVTVLLAFLQMHNEADGADLERQRKYVDVYDIAMSINPTDMRKAIERARRINPELDFDKAAADFRKNLAEYDAVKTYGRPELEVDTADAAAPTDTVPKPLSD